MTGNWFNKLKKKIAVITNASLILQIAFLGVNVNVAHAASSTIVISEVYADALDESGSEFVELYNITNAPIDISGWKIKTEISAADATLPFGASIPANGFYLIADADWSTSKDNPIWPDADHEETITFGNSDAGLSLLTDADVVIDAVGYGDSGVIIGGFEGTTVDNANIVSGQSIERKSNKVTELGNALDTDDNANDFALKVTSEPQNSSSAIEDIIAPNAPVVTLLDPITSANQNAVTITGTGEANAAIDWSIDDTNALTAAVTDSSTVDGAGDISIIGIDVSSLDDGILTVSATLTDAAGNISAAGINTATKDIIAPLISLVSFTPTSGTLKIGDTLDVTVTADGSDYSEGNIAVNGVVTTGFTNNSDNTYTATYTVFSEDTDRADDETIPVSITLFDAAGNESAEFTTSPLAVDSPAIDANAPVVSLVSFTPTSGTLKIGDTLDVTVTADGSDYSEGNIAVNGVVTTGFTNNSDNTYTATYTVFSEDTDRADDETIPVSITLFDAAGNESAEFTTSPLAVDSPAIDANAPAPIVTLQDQINSTNQNSINVTGSGEAGATVNYVITDELLNTVSGDGSDVVGVLGDINITGIDVSALADGTLTASVTLTDIAGNEGSEGIDTSEKDTILPVLTSLETIAPNPTNDLFTVTVTFSEDVQDFDLNDIQITNGSKSNFQGSGSAYSFDVTPDSDGPVTVSAVGSSFQDLSGNINTSDLELTRNYDGSKPSLELSSLTSNPTNGLISVTAEFSEDVTGFDGSDVDVVGGAIENFNTVDDNTYTFDINPDGGGNVAVQIEVLGNKALDLAGNENVASNQLFFTSDTVAPTVGLTTGSTDPTNDNPISVTAEFSEDVVGLDLGDITITNGNASNLLVVDGNTYTFDVSPIIDGQVTAEIIVGASLDTAGNPSEVSNILGFEYDGTGPVLVVSFQPADPTANPSFGFTSDEAGTINIGGDCTSGTTSAVVGSNIVSLTGLSEGLHDNCTVSVTDALGNTGNTLNIDSFVLDTIDPIITLNELLTNDSTPVISGTVDSVDTMIAVTVNGATYPGVITGTDWSASVGFVLADGAYDVRVFAVDLVGNEFDQTFEDAVKVDTENPELEVKIEPQTANKETKKVKITVIPSEELLVQSATTVLNQQVYALGTTYGVSVTVNEKDTPVTYLVPKGEDGKYILEHELTTTAEKDVAVTVNGTDLAGNEGMETSKFRLDNIAPAQVTELRAVIENGRVILTWVNPTNADFNGVRVVRDGKELNVDLLKGTSYVDSDVVIGVTYSYDVYAVDTAGNKGEKANAQASLPKEETAQTTQNPKKPKEEIKAATDTNTGAKQEGDKKDTEVKDEKKLPVWGIVFLVTLAGVGGYLFYTQSAAEAISKLKK